METPLRRTARRRLQGLVRTVRKVPGAADLQFAQRSLRKSPTRVDLLRRLAVPPRLPARAGAGLRGQVGLELQGVSAAAETGQLQHRRGDEEAGRRPARQVRRACFVQW